MEAQYGKFLNMICAIRINVPLVDVLAGIPNYEKFLKELISNKHKIKQFSAAFLSDESLAMIQNKIPPKLGDLGSFLIPCNFNKTFSCNALVDLGASINLMPYFLYAKLSLKTLKPTKMRLRLADRSFQYPVGIAKNTLVEVGKFTLLADFVILEMKEDSKLSKEKKNKLVSVLKKHKQAFAWKTTDIPGICPSFWKHNIQLLDDKKPVVQKQRRLNPNMQEVVKKEIMKLLDTGIIYPIANSSWVIPIHCVPKKGGITVVINKHDEHVPTRTVTSWRVCIDDRKLNEATAKDHFPLPFMDQMLERLTRNKYLCFLNGFYGYFQIPINPNDKEKTTFTCPFRTYAYRRMYFGLCNAPATFQRCMLAIFHDMIEESVEVSMDDFSVFENSFESCLNNLDKMLQHCRDAHLVLNWEKCHFMVKEGIVLGHKVSSARLEVDKAKVDVISKLPPLPILKDKLTCAPVIVILNWNLPFELMCDASDFAVGAVLGQKDVKNFHPIYFASKTLNPAQQKYIVTLKELMAIVFAFKKFRSYLILSKTIIHTDHLALRHLFKKQDAKPCLIRWILLLQEFDIEIKDRKGTENVTADHLSRTGNNKLSDDSEVDDNFTGETLMDINTKDEPWFADFANYLVGDVITKRITRCVSGPETQTVLDQCHHGPTGGNYRPNNTAKKYPPPKEPHCPQGENLEIDSQCYSLAPKKRHVQHYFYFFGHPSGRSFLSTFHPMNFFNCNT
nr:reverse transcriptase domain-containing protein [Tanacetum cinerariifolium]